MLFNSFVFISAFLPFTLVVFYLLGRSGYSKGNIIFLLAASLFFYGWWNISYIPLFAGSIIINYNIARHISKSVNNKKSLLVLGIILNLGYIAYFKYAGFLFLNINYLFETRFQILAITLPLAISFFTFQQIAYLVDTFKGKIWNHNIFYYSLFVSFFPQLIAGPIVFHHEFFPQILGKYFGKFKWENIAVGTTFFAVGLFKKVLLADNIALHSTPVFDSAELGNPITFFEAWSGALAYTFQIYFDFSGYSDMALGLARLFGIQLPLNFYSPYKAKSIIEFWRRWHITLSRFLLSSLYIPFGGNRKGSLRRYLNIIVTMLLGGLWHGASWTFVIWGGIHGIYLIINHGWRFLKEKANWKFKRYSLPRVLLSQILTFVCVLISWVLFRANSFDGAIHLLKSMASFKLVVLSENFLSLSPYVPNFVVFESEAGLNWLGSGSYMVVVQIIISLFVVWAMPNTAQILNHHLPKRFLERIENEQTPLRSQKFTQGNLSYLFAPGLVALMLAASIIILHVGGNSEFIYYQF